MPGKRRAPVKRPQARKIARRNKPLLLILGIEEPLTDAINYVQAMYLMGYGLISHHEAGGDAIVALAQETGQRLKAVKEIWNEMLGRDSELAARSAGERRSYASPTFSRHPEALAACSRRASKDGPQAQVAILRDAAQPRGSSG